MLSIIGVSLRSVKFDANSLRLSQFIADGHAEVTKLRLCRDE